jgi:hypothetical protein
MAAMPQAHKLHARHPRLLPTIAWDNAWSRSGARKTHKDTGQLSVTVAMQNR